MKERFKNLEKNWALTLINLFLIFYAIREGLIETGSEDFRIFLGASKALSELSNLYFVFFQTGKGDAMPYAYTPFFAMILSPFEILFSNKTIVFLWLIFNIFLLNRVLWILDRVLNFNNNQRVIFFIFLFSLRFILHNYDMAQVTIFWTYLMLEAYYQLEEKSRKIAPAFLIALGISIKILPIAMFFYFINKKRTDQIFWTILFAIVLNLLPFLFYPTDYLIFQYKDCWKTIYPFQEGFTYQLFDRATQGMPSLVSNYNQIFGNVLNQFQTLFLIVFISLVWLIGVFLTHLKSKCQNKDFILFGLTLFSASMLMPHQQHYSFFSAVVLYSIWVRWIFIEKNYSKIPLTFFILSTILMTFTSDLFVGNDLKSIFKSYGVIGIGGVFLVVSILLNHCFINKKIKTQSL